MDGVNSRNVGMNATMVDVDLVEHLMNSSMVDVKVLGACVELVKQRVKSVSVDKIQLKDCMNSSDVCICSTMVGVNVLHVAVCYTMVDMNARAGRKSAWRCHARSSETAHDVAHVAAEDFDQLEAVEIVGTLPPASRTPI